MENLINTNIDLYIENLIKKALEFKASDIHIEAMDRNYARIRLRIDGRLNSLTKLKYDDYIKLVTKIKILAKLDIAEKRRPQDGYLKLKSFPDIDFRISSLNTIVGEKLVLRILSLDYFKNSAKLLGFSDESKKILKKAIKNKAGMIIFTGPTGSGKSTSLYSLLGRLNKEETNIVTIENPVEINVLGINQISTNEKIGLTFAKALRSILRQDPDIIMLGEIRDKETAHMAVRAAITGHLVLSTLHTKDAISAIARLKDLGIEDYLISGSVNTLAGQRLVRKLCFCKRPRKIREDEYRLASKYFDISKDKIVFEPNGCKNCKDGYLGREAVEEIIEFDDDYKKLFLQKGQFSKDDLEKLYKEKSFKSMAYNGIKKVLDGVTSFDEIFESIYF